MSEPSSDISVDMDKLQAKIQELQIAMSIIQQILHSAEGFYHQAQSNLNQLQTRKDNLSQILQTELKVQQDIEYPSSIECYNSNRCR
jgi:hypothetical protein